MSEPKDLRVVVNIPFCARQCTYCDFPVCANSTSGLRSAYMAALDAELDSTLECFEGYRVRSIYVTGGTPTTVAPKELASFIGRFKDECDVADDVEITIDTNPGAIGVDALSQFKHAGVNRFDIGYCTAHPLEFETLVRPYGWNDIHFSEMLFEFSSFKNYSLDFLYGLPGQTPKSLHDNIEEGLRLNPAPRHLTIIPLRLVPGTKFYRCFVEGDTKTRIITHNRTLPDEATRLATYERACRELPELGFEQYTTNHFAQPGYRCRHFELGCRDTDVVGLGLAAQSCTAGLLVTNTRDLQTYIDAAGDPAKTVMGAIALDEASRMGRFLASGLAAVEGVSKAAFAERFDRDLDDAFGDRIAPLVTEGLLAEGDGRIAYTVRGAFLGETVVRRLQGIGE